MKTGILLLICLVIIGSNIYGQNFTQSLIANSVPVEIVVNEKFDPPRGTGTLPEQKLINDHKLTDPVDGRTLITGRTIIHFPGSGSGLEISNGHTYATRPLHINRNEYTRYPMLLLTRLAIMTGTFSYFINSSNNKYKEGLKLTCQKNSFGASNKACKKVTSLTFSIPIGNIHALSF